MGVWEAEMVKDQKFDSGRKKRWQGRKFNTPLLQHSLTPLLLFIILFFSPAWASDLPHIGYVYPAGGVPGSTFTVTIGGQYLKDTLGLHVSGGRVGAEVMNYTFEPDPRAGNRARNMKAKMEAALKEEKGVTERKQLQYQIDQSIDMMVKVRAARQDKRKNPEMYAKKQFNPQLADTVTLRVTIDGDAEPGEHELRLITTNGLSNHLMFHVGGLDEVLEAEPNDDVADTLGAAPKLPLLLNGQIMPGDVDSFRFYAGRGDELVFQVQARSLVPYLADAVPGWFQAVLTLYNADGKELAYVDDFRFDPDPVLMYRIPSDGEYILEIRDSIYRGRRDFIYRISAGELPFIDHIFPLGGPENSEVSVQLYGVNLPQKKLKLQTAANAPDVQNITVGRGTKRSNSRPFAVDVLPETFETEPNNLPSQAQAVEEGVIINGRIEKPGDFDCFSFKGYKGDVFSAEVFARRLDSPLDARLVLLGPEEHLLAVSDDEVDRGTGLVTHHADSLLRYELSQSGTYTLRLDDLQGKGGHEYAYRLRIGDTPPDFSLRMVPPSLSIPRNGSAVITVHVLRKAGFDRPVELSIKNAPDGIELHRAIIPAGFDKTHLTLSASGRDPEELMAVEIEGKARIDKRTVRRPAVPAEDRMQAFLYRHLVSAEELLVRVTEPRPVSVKLELPQNGLIEVRPGGAIMIPVEIRYQPNVSGSIRIDLSDPPEWIVQKTKRLQGDRTRGQEVVLRVSEEAESGTFESLILKGRITLMKSEDDPTYNPLFKWVNRQNYDFVIGAIPVMID